MADECKTGAVRDVWADPATWAFHALKPESTVPGKDGSPCVMARVAATRLSARLNIPVAAADVYFSAAGADLRYEPASSPCARCR